MSGYKCFQIELSRGYDYTAFREDIKKLYTYAGVDGENTVFLFSDTQVTQKCFIDLPRSCTNLFANISFI